MSYDVIITGAGPSGSILAYQLAKKGFKVLILEKFPLPRYKSCGGGIPLKTLKEIPFDINPIIEKKASGGLVTFKGNILLRAEEKEDIAWLVMRDSFDFYLTQKAVEAGAELINPAKVNQVLLNEDSVTVLTSQGEFSGKFLAGTDGVNSLVAGSSGLLPKRETGIAIEAELKVPRQALQSQGNFASFDFGALPHGYGWIFPKKDHLSCGVFYASKNKNSHLEEQLHQYLKMNPVLKEHEILQIRGHRIPLGGKNQILHHKRVLLTGDAANLADAWLGEGIYYAVKSANIAADILQKNLLSGNSDLQEYSAIINRTINHDLHYARNFANLAYNLPRFMLYVLQKSPVVQDLIFNTIRGKLNFEDLQKLMIRKLPLILIQLIQSIGK